MPSKVKLQGFCSFTFQPKDLSFPLLYSTPSHHLWALWFHQRGWVQCWLIFHIPSTIKVPRLQHKSFNGNSLCGLVWSCLIYSHFYLHHHVHYSMNISFWTLETDLIIKVCWLFLTWDENELKWKFIFP